MERWVVREIQVRVGKRDTNRETDRKNETGAVRPCADRIACADGDTVRPTGSIISLKDRDLSLRTKPRATEFGNLPG